MAGLVDTLSQFGGAGLRKGAAGEWMTDPAKVASLLVDPQLPLLSDRFRRRLLATLITHDELDLQ